MDLIFTEFAAAAVVQGVPGRIVHVSSGDRAPRHGALLDFLAELFARHHRDWATSAVAHPDIVDAQPFALLEASVWQSGDLLLQ